MSSSHLLDAVEQRPHEIARVIAPQVLAAMQPYQAYAEAGTAMQVLEQVRQHIQLIAQMARNGRPPEARELEFARQVGRSRVGAAPLGAVLHGYRVGHRAMVDWIASEAGSDPEVLREALRLAACCFEYHDQATTALAVGYLQQQQQGHAVHSPLAELRGAPSEATVRALLALGPGGLVQLSPRERELAGLVAQGLTNKEIAQRLRISLHTTKEYMSRVLEKTRLPSRAAVAAAYAAQHQGLKAESVTRSSADCVLGYNAACRPNF